MNDSSDDTGRVKGSIKDRLKSFLYRKRYRIKLEKNSPVKKETKVKFKSYKKFKINDVRDLKKLGDKVIPVDLKTEKFDFERYDYYIIEPVKKKGIDNKTEEEAQRKKKTVESTKNKIKEVKVVTNSAQTDLNNKKEAEKKLIKEKEELKKKRTEIEESIKKIKEAKVDSKYVDEIKLNSMKDIENAIKIIETYEDEIKKNDELLNDKKQLVYSKISDLKKDIYSLEIDNINTDDLDNIKLENEEDIAFALEKIDYYEKEIEKYENNLDVVSAINTVEFINPVGVEVETEEEVKIEKVQKRETLEENKEIEENKKNIDDKANIDLYKASEEKINKKKLEIANKYDGKVINNLKKTDKIVKDYLDDINHIVSVMNKEVDKVTKEVREVTKVEGYGRLIKSTLTVAAGIFTLPLSHANIFNAALGSVLINKGIKGVRQGVETKKEVKIDYNYEDLTEKIRNTKDKLELTQMMIKDSLSQIDILKEYENLGEENLSMLNDLEDRLNKKLKEIDNININLNKQDERNKIKIKKVERKEY